MRVLLEAPILTQSGYGEHSRLIYRALKAVHETVAVFINPLNWGQTSWVPLEDDLERLEIEQAIKNNQELQNRAKQLRHDYKQTDLFDIHIFVGILNEHKRKGIHSICVTAGIETDRIAPEWLLKTNKEVDQIIVPSEHAKMGFTKTSYRMVNESNKTESSLECSCPVSVVPYPVKNVNSKHLDFSLDTDFNFLTVALLGPRKNLEFTIQTFVQEFKNDNVGLIIKSARSRGSSMDKSYTTNFFNKIMSKINEKYPNKKCKVFLLHGDLSEEEIHSLYIREDINAYVSATHGEGYGLPIFEAAYSGLPIVATDWSGHLDFLTAPFLEKGKIRNKKLFAKVDYDLKPISKEAIWPGVLMEGSEWAYPKAPSLRKQMRSVYKNHGMYRKWSSSLRDHITKTHAEEEIFKKMRRAIFSSTYTEQDLDSIEEYSAEAAIQEKERLEWAKEMAQIIKL